MFERLSSSLTSLHLFGDVEFDLLDHPLHVESLPDDALDLASTNIRRVRDLMDVIIVFVVSSFPDLSVCSIHRGSDGVVSSGDLEITGNLLFLSFAGFKKVKSLTPSMNSTDFDLRSIFLLSLKSLFCFRLIRRRV